MSAPFRTGLGFDSHVFDPSRPLKLGGVEIPGAPGLRGHSDADALLHAVIDALFGAAGLPDIGAHFPDSDPRWKNADSAELLAAAVAEVRALGWTVGNVDATVVAETPKLKPHVAAIRSRIASLLGCAEDDVSVKGKTNEGMDDIGARRGLCVYAAVLLYRSGAF